MVTEILIMLFAKLFHKMSNDDLLLTLIDFWKDNGQEIWSNKYCRESNDYSGRHPKFGMSIISPVFLSTIFLLFHWWRTESNIMNKLITFQLVICQIWYQYRIARILYFGLIKQNRRWRTENENLKKNVSSLGK